MENTVEITVFQLFSKLPLNIRKYVNGFGLAISKLRENTLFYIPDVFLEAFLIFKH